MVLRHDDVRVQTAQDVGLDAVNAQSFLHNLADAPVDLFTRPVRVEFRLGQNRQSDDVGRIVAFVRDPDEPLTQSDCAHDLRAARQE